MDWNMEVQKVENNNCNLTTCRYNQSGTCTNEEKRKECVEVSKRVLCLEDRAEIKNKSQKVSQSEIVRRYLITSDTDRKILKTKFPFIDFSEESMIRFLEQLEGNNIEYDFLEELRELE